MRQLMPPEEPPAADADRGCAFGEARVSEPVELRADDPVGTGPSGNQERADEHEQTRVGGAHEDFDEDERDQRRRDRRHEIGHRFGRHAQGQPPGAERGDNHTREHASQAGEQDDRERCPGASEHQAEQVASQDVGSKRKDQPGVVWPWVGAMFDNEVDGLVGGQPRSKKRDDQQSQEGNRRTERCRIRLRGEREARRPR